MRERREMEEKIEEKQRRAGRKEREKVIWLNRWQKYGDIGVNVDAISAKPGWFWSKLVK